MNIFYVDHDPMLAAQQMVDKHVVKMILETAQLLSTAHRLLDGEEYVGTSKTGRKVKRWCLPDERDTILYSATHINHPSAVWARQSKANYQWLFQHFIGLLDEYEYRYGKVHKCANVDFVGALSRFPTNLPDKMMTAPTPAMPEEYKVFVGGNLDALASYRKYYANGKTHLHKYTKREMPAWLLAA